MANARIGALRVDLGMNTAAFEKGATLAERRLGKMQKGFAAFGKSIAVGVAAGTAAIAGLNRMVGDLANRAKELDNSAQLSGESFESFQRLAYAAREVGIEQGKLADIFKDTRERVGEFVVGGTGPLQDAFDALNGKVNLTIDELRGLSGKEALQLIYDRMQEAKLSTEEMSFVLESLGSDATALIPLLKDGGKAFGEFGKNANVISEDQLEKLRQYERAQQKMADAMDRLVLALVDSGLIDGMIDFADALSAVSIGFAGVEDSAGGAEAAMQDNAGWVQLGQDIRKTSDWLSQLVTDFDNYTLSTAKASRENQARIKAWFVGMWESFDAWRTRLKEGAAAIPELMRRMVDGIWEQIVGRLSRMWGRAKEQITEVKGYFYDLYDAVVGNSYIPDMVDEIGQHMRRLDQQMVDPAQKATQTAAEAFRSLAFEANMLLERLFPQYARMMAMQRDLASIDEYEAKGIYSESVANEARFRARGGGREFDVSSHLLNTGSLIDTDALKENIAQFNKQLGIMKDGAETKTVRIAKSFKDMAQETMNALKGMVDSIKSGDFLDILSGVVNMVLQLGSAGLFGQKFATGLNTTFDGARAMGGPVSAGKTYLVGEKGPELFSPGSSGSIIPNHELGGGSIAQIVPSPYFDVVVDGRIVRAAPAIVGASAGAGVARMQRMEDRRLA